MSKIMKQGIYYILEGMQYITECRKRHVGETKPISGYVTDFWVRALDRRIIEYRLYIFNWVLFDNLSREMNKKMIEYTKHHTSSNNKGMYEVVK